MSSPPDDYRNSHLEKGTDYDSDLAQGYFNSYMTEREHIVLDRIITHKFPNGIPRYLDFACGTGRITAHLASNSAESYGIDVSENMQVVARKKCPKTRFILQDITSEPLKIDPVDLVTAFRFFGNAQDELREHVLEELSCIVKPGGYLVFNNHRNPWSIHNILLQLCGNIVDVDLSYKKISKLLKQAGFSIERTYGIGAWYIMHRLNTPAVMSSRLVRIIEFISLFKPLGPFCPDAIIVAKKQ